MSYHDYTLLHPGGMLISRTLTEEDVRAFLGLAAPECGADAHSEYRLPVFSQAGVQVNIALFFNQACLDHIKVWDGHPRFGKNWEDWTEARERERAASIGKWLKAQGIHAGGNVRVEYDAKAGFGSASIRL